MNFDRFFIFFLEWNGPSIVQSTDTLPLWVCVRVCVCVFIRNILSFWDSDQWNSPVNWLSTGTCVYFQWDRFLFTHPHIPTQNLTELCHAILCTLKCFSILISVILTVRSFLRFLFHPWKCRILYCCCFRLFYFSFFFSLSSPFVVRRAWFSWFGCLRNCTGRMCTSSNSKEKRIPVGMWVHTNEWNNCFG